MAPHHPAHSEFKPPSQVWAPLWANGPGFLLNPPVFAANRQPVRGYSLPVPQGGMGQMILWGHPPTMPSADFSTVFSADCSTPSFANEAPERSPGVRHVTVTTRTSNLQSASQPQLEDFTVTCPLVPDAPRLISGSCSSPRSFGFGFLQTPPRDDALAVSLAFGSAKTWLPDSHRHSYVPCPAHTFG